MESSNMYSQKAEQCVK